MGSRIVATNFCVPPDVETSRDLAQRIGRSEQWILDYTGVQQRHVAGTLKDPAVLAACAARPLIDSCGAPDCLIYAGAIPRQMLPDLSVFVHRELQLSGTAAFSINTACLSFLSALIVADALISRGVYQRILICVAELASRGRNFSEPESAALLGDGAAAVVVESVPGESCILHSRLETWSEGANLAGLKGGGTLLTPDDPKVTSADHQFFMQGEQLLRVIIPRLRQFLDQFFRESPVSQDDVRLVVPHQPSGPALQLLNRWGFEESKVVNMIADYGNCVAASLPMALAAAERDNRIQRGDPILLLGTAAGISLGAALVQW
jgi:3-oxoacyl-[acyl-carrier-protein] synthase-3